MSSVVLKTVIFMGSAKNVTPPWGGVARLGDGVLQWVVNTLKTRAATVGDQTVTHEVTVFDPYEVFGEGGALQDSGGQLQAPVFFQKAEDVNPKAASMGATLKAADCFVIVTPECNHSIPPALSSMMGHFGGSNYAYKMSAIVTYSPGPWGGARCAMALRPFLSELGCLPVSKVCGIPSVSELIAPDGTPVDPDARMLKQLPQMLEQLEWFTLATKHQRSVTGM